MKQPFRTAQGGRIDRSRPVFFTFNGRQYAGHAGDTLASALLANGVHLVGRSFKYHRPRGILSAGCEEPSALVQLEKGGLTEPNMRAPVVELYDDLAATSQNAWPSVEHDIGAVNGLLSKLFVAGFYYKTFMSPKSFWMKVYEPFIRRAAGLGKAPTEGDLDIYDKMHAHCDVLVVGGGPAGLAAARAAAASGARVILIDEQNELGGALLSADELIDGNPALDWVAGIQAELLANPEVRILTRTTVTGYYDHNYLIAAQRRTDHLPRRAAGKTARQRLWKIRAARVVLATGAHERPLVFADNDRPGVMLAAAARTYANRYGALVGKKVVVFTNNDSAYEAAFDLKIAGAAIPAIVDLRPEAGQGLLERARNLGIPVIAQGAIVGVKGTKRVAGALVMRLAEAGEAFADTQPAELECDAIAMSGGWSPAVHLFSQSQGKLRFDDAKACFVPDVAAQHQASVGACNGSFELGACLAEGLDAGAAAAEAAGFPATAKLVAPVAQSRAFGTIKQTWVVPSLRPVGHGKAKHFIDFQNDVTAADVALAHREGYKHVEHLKRYTTMGMATDQGKTSNVNALGYLSTMLGTSIPEIGTTTFRAPYTPVTFGTLAGRDVGHLADPERHTPIHAWHVARGALFEDVGQWKRAWYYPRPGETMEAAVSRECRAVRESVGVLDASTLGKIDVQGQDAVTFLNLLYTSAFSKLEIGKARYALLCKEDGMVMDDGIVARVGPSRFYLTTTTGGAAKVLDWMEDYLQTEWPHLKVYLTSITEQWTVAQVAGPKARAVLEKLTDTKLDKESFPFMAVKDATVAGLKARIFRVSFTGELSFEVAVPAHQGKQLWEAIFAAGDEFGITPFGTEAMHVLRAEKGFIIVGQETDATVTPQDLGMGGMVSRLKPDFVGKRAYTRADTARVDRKQLVGLLTDEPQTVLPEGAQLVEVSDDPALTKGGTSPLPAPVPMIGHVTSSYWSPTLGRSIALALVKGGSARHGQVIMAPLTTGAVRCTITGPVFYDAEGKRANG
ncbi:sarcosine oxidase subunit alpha [Arboricoccus pini]|uniref:Sarcosine oxidase subunit alpha n=1 Tax=Arboricoccus pini TaxID=1963835 RepID=A0A212R904_9PROT|nr:sarcosine oxidase subunit alpha family protein [Arboricoccus pini]SNB68637.1 sarcosine oxidase subunit alpha [Arboricoccus pini]